MPEPVPSKKPRVALVMAGLMLGILLFGLDQTVVGTSLFTIVSDIGGFEHFSWLFAAYMLASTIVIPIAGKLSDIYGRRPLFIAGMGVFLLGSVLCGTATNMSQLIAYRAVQGIGGGAIFPVAFATIADLFPPSERGRVGGLIGAVFGFSSVVGPFLGGWIVDNMHVGDIASWRWVFYVNVPVGALGIAMVAAFFPRIQTRRGVPIDYAGSITLSLGLLTGLLITVWGGDQYAWTSWQILALGATSLVSLGAFVLVEGRAKDPIIPLALFRDPIFRVAVIASILSGAVMFSIIAFMPTYLQGVVGISATYAGTALIPLSMGIVGGSISSGILMKRFGYKPFAVSGFVIALVGYLLLSRLGNEPSLALAVAEMFLLGIGIGFTIQTFIIAVQNAVDRKHVGVSTSSITLFRTLGATVGITILGVILNRKLESELPRRLAPETIQELLQSPLVAGKVGAIPTLLREPTFLANAPPAVIDGIKDSFSEGMTLLFLISAALCVVAIAVAAMLKSLPMKTAEEYNAEQAPVAVEM